jgi:hypothetical protein
MLRRDRETDIAEAIEELLNAKGIDVIGDWIIVVEAMFPHDDDPLGNHGVVVMSKDSTTESAAILLATSASSIIRGENAD